MPLVVLLVVELEWNSKSLLLKLRSCSLAVVLLHLVLSEVDSKGCRNLWDNYSTVLNVLSYASDCCSVDVAVKYYVVSSLYISVLPLVILNTVSHVSLEISVCENIVDDEIMDCECLCSVSVSSLNLESNPCKSVVEHYSNVLSSSVSVVWNSDRRKHEVNSLCCVARLSVVHREHLVYWIVSYARNSSRAIARETEVTVLWPIVSVVLTCPVDTAVSEYLVVEVNLVRISCVTIPVSPYAEFLSLRILYTVDSIVDSLSHI